MTTDPGKPTENFAAAHNLGQTPAKEGGVSVHVSGDRIQLEFLIEDLAKRLVIDRGPLVANGCNGCSSCS